MNLQVFEYIEELDAFKVCPEFAEVCGKLGLNEWGIGPIFIGRYFCMDNDFGEHFSDSWDERDENEQAIKAAGYKEENLLFIRAEAFQDGRDGPCHSPKMRKMFWTDVFKSLQLSPEFLFDEARRTEKRYGRHHERSPAERLAALEKAIVEIRKVTGE